MPNIYNYEVIIWPDKNQGVHDEYYYKTGEVKASSLEEAKPVVQEVVDEYAVKYETVYAYFKRDRDDLADVADDDLYVRSDPELITFSVIIGHEPDGEFIPFPDHDINSNLGFNEFRLRDMYDAIQYALEFAYSKTLPTKDFACEITDLVSDLTRLIRSTEYKADRHGQFRPTLPIDSAHLDGMW